ncbi:hypothetical protein M378DRAFT_154882 [Amanita muscaria Koide BX008]|uniref:Uncharacterized protein n=1 Tax=Amanita muscaria (strain Koide BX008) TaxID=946122 RepID=A0A0C2T5T8_AMAMK|nr:hypothetical protein M378DRAFT_154882 [Amanita muscaria Koide BX008]
MTQFISNNSRLFRRYDREGSLNMDMKTEHGPGQLAGGNICQPKHGRTITFQNSSFVTMRGPRHSFKKTASNTAMQLHRLFS